MTFLLPEPDVPALFAESEALYSRSEALLAEADTNPGLATDQALGRLLVEINQMRFRLYMAGQALRAQNQ